MAGNVIFRGPIERQYRTVERPVTGALVPGSWVEDTGTALAQITTAIAKRPLILANLDPKGQDIATAYVSGDTGLAIEVQVNDVVQSRMAAATYAKGAPLTVAASGRLAAATAGTRVVAYFDDVPGAYSAGALADVIVADGYIVPA
jgi:phenolic acid decarboxylase